MCDGVENGCAAKYGKGLVTPKDINDPGYIVDTKVNISFYFIKSRKIRGYLKRFWYNTTEKTRCDRVCLSLCVLMCLNV